MRPFAAILSRVGILMRPPYGDHAAKPVSSKRIIRIFGAPSGAFFRVNGPQSALESRISSFIVPLKSGGGFGTAQPDGEEAGLVWAEVDDGAIATKPSNNQQNAISVFIWRIFHCCLGTAQASPTAAMRRNAYHATARLFLTPPP